jgi:hypothetical protein
LFARIRGRGKSIRDSRFATIDAPSVPLSKSVAFDDGRSKQQRTSAVPKTPFLPVSQIILPKTVLNALLGRITTTIRCSRTTENPGSAGVRPATRKTGPLTPMAHQASFHHANHRFQLQTPGQRSGGPESDFLSAEVEDTTLLWFTSDNCGDYVSGTSVEPAPSSGEKKKDAMKGDSQ